MTGEGPWRTKTGRLIAAADLDRWAEEAEAGYELKEGRWMPVRRAQEYDGVLYAPGRKFRVTQPGLSLIGWTSHPLGGHQGWKQDLNPGDELTCLGFGRGWGSDPGYGIEFETEESRAAHAGNCDTYPHAGGVFDYRPPPGYMEPVTEEGTT